MKLIIDIPEQMYLNAKEDLLSGSDTLVSSIKNGIPLKQIKAEIEQMNNMDYVKPVSVDEILQIIDKYSE